MLGHFLCGNFLGHFDDQHESPPASDPSESESEKDLYMPRDCETPAGKTKKTFTYGRAGRDWNQYRMPIVVESRIGKEVIRSQFVGIRVTRRELAPGMAKKLAQVDVHTIEIIQCKLKEEPPLSEMSVVVLKLSRNELTCLSRPEKPKEEQKPLRLETFACDRNKLQQVEPGALSEKLVASLQVLDLSRNQLSFLPGDFLSGARQLRYLDLSHNQLFSLPDSILGCRRLLILKVDSNEIEQLPNSFGQLRGLRKLTASYNALTQLPEDIGECKLLEKIRVVNNQITVMPHSLLQLWKQKGGALEELLVDGNPLIQPSITAFQMGGLDQALRLFGEWVAMEESQEAEDQVAPLPEELVTTVEEQHRSSVTSGRDSAFLRDSAVMRDSMRESILFAEVDEVSSVAPSSRPDRPAGDQDEFHLEDLDLEVVQVIESGKRMSKFTMSQTDFDRLQERCSKSQSDDQLEPYYFSHVQGDSSEIHSIRSAESALLLLKKRYFVLRQQDIAMELTKAAGDDAEALERDVTPELWELFRAEFDPMKYNGKVPIQDLDLYFCTLVYGSKPAFTSIHALWDKFEVGEKGHMTKDEWLNLCTRVRTKLPKNAQLDIWSQLAWRDKVKIQKQDFVAGWHIHDPELNDVHIKSTAENLKLEYYGMSVEELQERMRTRLAEDAEVNFSRPGERKGNTIVSLPMGEGERRFDVRDVRERDGIW
ncbi:unnamed protein product [Durusdinium trenchii]|uniref:Disease resistance R13L4/SHOC-2-like LRR domain-containing protein n=2 Tax=Durusdinium trenchii TaxID=1381693 RepID=A0ABP0KTX4_9DINO